jgi:hypothetical protein
VTRGRRESEGRMTGWAGIKRCIRIADGPKKNPPLVKCVVMAIGQNRQQRGRGNFFDIRFSLGRDLHSDTRSYVSFSHLGQMQMKYEGET